MTDRYANIMEALKSLDAAGGDVRMSTEMRSYIEGMSVSVDVSTGDHDAGHRYFGTVTEVMDCKGDKHGVTLLVQDAEPNFSQTPATNADARDAERYRLLRKGAIYDVAVVCGLGAMDYGMSAVVYTYSEEIDGDDLDAAIDAAMAKENKA